MNIIERVKARLHRRKSRRRAVLLLPPDGSNPMRAAVEASEAMLPRVHEVITADDYFIRLIGSLVGQNLPNGCPWVLPSGKVITAAEMRRLIKETP